MQTKLETLLLKLETAGDPKIHLAAKALVKEVNAVEVSEGQWKVGPDGISAHVAVVAGGRFVAILENHTWWFVEESGVLSCDRVRYLKEKINGSN